MEGWRPASVRPRTPEIHFPAMERLDDQLAALDPDTRIIVLMPPVHASGLPPAGSAAADTLAQCKGALQRLATARRHGAFVDFAVDGDIARAPENFMDVSHYRAGVARQIEDQLARTLRQLGRTEP